MRLYMSWKKDEEQCDGDAAGARPWSCIIKMTKIIPIKCKHPCIVCTLTCMLFVCVHFAANSETEYNIRNLMGLLLTLNRICLFL